jgi:phosphatidate phosphatase PAH1
VHRPTLFVLLILSAHLLVVSQEWGGLRPAVMAWSRSLKDSARTVLTEVTNKAFRHHSGACDVLIVRHEGKLRTSQWHVHLGRDFPQHVQLHLELAGARTGLTMHVGDDKKAFFPDRAANNLCPGASELAAIPLKSGYNEGMFRVEEATDGTCKVLGSIAIGVFVWDASDRVIVADIEGVVLKADIWSKAETAIKARADSAMGTENVRDGVGQLLSFFDRAGYRILLLNAAVRVACPHVLRTCACPCMRVCARAYVHV